MLSFEADGKAERLLRRTILEELERLVALQIGKVDRLPICDLVVRSLTGKALEIVELGGGKIAPEAILADEAGAIAGFSQPRRIGLPEGPAGERLRGTAESVA